MQPRLRARSVVSCVLFIACGRGAQSNAPDGANTDAGIDSPDDPDFNPPKVVATEPSSELWLHEPVRFVFSEPVDIEGATATATIGGSPVGVTLALEGDRVVAVSLPSTLRGVGGVEVTLGGVIKDRGGNAAEVPIVAQLSVPAWSTPPIDRGAAVDAPALAIDQDAVVAAWLVGGQVVASRYRGAWESLGDAFASGASSVSASVDDFGTPLVAWIEGGTAHVVRMQPNGRADLGSPGTGTRVVLAGTKVAVFGATVQVRSLTAQDTWAVDADYALNGALVGEPAFTGTAVGWIDRSGSSTQIRVYNNGTAMSPLTVDDATRVSLASRGNTLAMAWDEFGGSWNVAAALASGTSWSRLGRILDVDAAGNASSPAIALDSAGKPVVAWRERIEMAERGVVARWTGAAWAPMGNAQWNVAPSVPSRPALVLRDDVPAIASIAGATLHVTRFNGPNEAGPGMQRASISGCSVDPNNPPATLFATGCFSAGPTPHPGLVPYDIINELWTDGAKKRRWIGLPNGASMTVSATDAWAAPAGTIIAKEFAVETTPGNPATRKPVETRLLVQTGSGWLGFSYMWRDDGSNADLLNDGTYTKDWALAGGGTYRHLYPSRSQCLSCHENSFGPLLGIRNAQLQRWYDYNGTIADQALTLAAIGVGPQATGAPYISTHDRSATWEQRTRSYMAANCAHCHNPNHIAIKDLRITTPLAQTRLCESIQPGSPPNSVVYARVTQRPGMPPLGTLVADPLIEQTLGRWISGMTSCP
jgi:hypothetical protein